jgi:hypothetical protein
MPTYHSPFVISLGSLLDYSFTLGNSLAVCKPPIFKLSVMLNAGWFDAILHMEGIGEFLG